MIQRIKKYSMARLYAEIIRSCFITLCHVKDVNYRVWGAFTLYKIPQILKQLHMQNKREWHFVKKKFNGHLVFKFF